ncbi:hypothetical protein TREES_T100001041 [Tupaia chinensis]|uniref:Uncharacterized protein n=1 Tax=Tupaia chinensis TaxID=246437 RepID=L9JCJ2_TUPCH|nr:hypothetical protein TREES_T100001041 [Tupaia chinensis]
MLTYLGSAPSCLFIHFRETEASLAKGLNHVTEEVWGIPNNGNQNICFLLEKRAIAIDKGSTTMVLHVPIPLFICSICFLLEKRAIAIDKVDQ